MLICNNVNCHYGARHVFEGVSFSAAPGTVIVLHGHNGTGKTSLLHMVAGLKKPSSGNITWNTMEVGDAIRNNDCEVTFIGHETMVKPELTVLENIYFWADLCGERESVPFALKKLGLEQYEDTICAELSKGWQRRVALSRLIFCTADLWVLDEPYNNLDHDVSKLLDTLVAEKSAAGGIILLSSHMYVPIEQAVKINISDFAPSNQAIAS